MHPTGGTRRVLRHFVWLGAGSVKAALSRPAHQRVTQAVRRSCAPPLRRGACPPNGARDPSPCSAPFLEDQESQRIVKQIRRSTARKREGHRSGADCGSPNPGKLLGLIRSAEQRDEADGAGADDFLSVSSCPTCGTSRNRYVLAPPDRLQGGDPHFELGKS